MAATEPDPEGELFFGVDARHIRQLGQELVGDRTTALTELIKNAYDADATEVNLRFSRASRRRGGVLEVEDDGVGMRLADVARGWMRISTDVKDREARSKKYRRARAGRKGIGRFATETLGRKLRLWTTVWGEATALVIEFDWEADYPAGQNLTEIANPFWREPVAKSTHGTVLKIEGLNDAWGDDARQRVRRAIRLLQPPFQPPQPKRSKPTKKTADPGFRIKVEVDGKPDPLTLAGYDDFLAAGTARVRARVTSKGELKVRVISELFDLDREETLAGRYRQTGPFIFEASYFVFRRDALGGVTTKVARDMAQEYAGIRLYRDGLRVMPYGERDNDWLQLDRLQGQRSTLVPIANLNWFGQVAITRRSNKALRDTASREGLVENAAFDQLHSAVRHGLVWAASEVGNARQRKVKASSRSPSKSRRDVLAAAKADVTRAVRRELSASVAERVMPIVTAALDEAGSDASVSDRAESRRIEELIDELELLRVLASLGTSIAVFGHEVRSALTTTAGALAALGAGDHDNERLERATNAVRELQDLVGYIDAYVSASQRRQREPQPLATVTREFKNHLSENLARNVEFKLAVTPPALRTAPMARSELDAVLINLLTNAVKAMDGEGHPRRRISIEATGQGGEVKLRFQDTGAGIDPKIRNRIFEPFVSDTRSPVSELGAGTGLGLKIVKDIVEDNGGSVDIAKADKGYATCVEVHLPRWQKQRANA